MSASSKARPSEADQKYRPTCLGVIVCSQCRSDGHIYSDDFGMTCAKCGPASRMTYSHLSPVHCSSE